MRLSLEGLSVGDALGEKFFASRKETQRWIESRQVPEGPWEYTDDTEMAISVVEVLDLVGGIDPDLLARLFSRRYSAWRGYGTNARKLLERFREGADWRAEAAASFGGQGSFGNGAAMRVAPLGAYFADDLDDAADHAKASAVVTHAHPEGIAGAVAVAVAAALACRVGTGEDDGARFLERVAACTPAGDTRAGIEAAMEIPLDTDPAVVANKLGSGEAISAPDTVPFCLWSASRHLDNYVDAFWTTVSGYGDRDTTCAIVGGIVACSAGDTIPPEWVEAREPIPEVIVDDPDRETHA